MSPFECRIVQWRHDSRLLLLLNWFLHGIKRTLHVGSKIWILCSRGKNNISLVRFAHSWDIYCSCHSNIKFISSRHRVISSIYFGANNAVLVPVFFVHWRRRRHENISVLKVPTKATAGQLRTFKPVHSSLKTGRDLCCHWQASKLYFLNYSQTCLNSGPKGVVFQPFWI